MEEEVNYASVVFKTNKHAKPEAEKHEETVYDEVKVQNEKSKTSKESGDTNNDKVNDGRRRYQLLACCLGITCVIVLLGIIAVVVYFSTLSHEREQSKLRENQTAEHLLATNQNLTNLVRNLSSENQNLLRDRENLTVQFDNLTQAYAVLDHKITNLTAQNQNLTVQNQQLETQNQNLTVQIQQLETQRNNLTEKIQDMEMKWKEQNISRAQWSFDVYCRNQPDKQCKPCRSGWLKNQSSCFVSKNAPPVERRSWDDARADCIEHNSDLAVIDNAEQKAFVSEISYGSFETTGFWIGLRVTDGKWKWVDGSELAESSWITQPPVAGQCAISVKNQGLKSVSCEQRQQWICKMKALTL